MWQLVPAVLVLLVPAGGVCSDAGKTVSSHLSSKWPTMPLLLEAAEFMADESPATYWTFVELVCKWDTAEYWTKTAESQHAYTMAASGRIVSEARGELLELSLALHVYAPKLEMFRQVALERGVGRDNSSSVPCTGDVVADVNGEVVCEVAELAGAVKKAAEVEGAAKNKPLIYDIDHRYPGGEGNPVGVVLYAELGTASFNAYHEVLLKLVAEGSVDYVFRPYVKRTLDTEVRLSGYGIELAIKNTEYKAQDDTKLEAEEGEGSQGVVHEAPVHGINFAVLKKRFPEQTEDLMAFKKHIKETSHDLAPMKVWQLQHLSMQVAQKVLAAPTPAEQLSALTYYSHNFPRLARGLTQIKVDDKMKREILRNQEYLDKNFGISPTHSALFVNGQHFDMEYTDIFTLLEHIKSEQRLMEGLYNLGLRGDKIQDVLNLDTSNDMMSGHPSGSSTAPQYGLDIRDTSIIWLNDLETDSSYKRWPSDVSDLLRPSYPGMMRQLRKNIHNLVVMVNPVSTETPDLLNSLTGLLGHNVPIRMGVVFDVTAEKSATGKRDAGVAILCAFNYVVQSHEGEVANKKGFIFLKEMYTSLGESEVTAEAVMNYFSGRYKSEDLEDVFGEDSDFDVGRRVAREFIGKGGFQSMPQALFNGIPLPSRQLAGEEFEEAIVMEVMKNTQFIQMAVYKQQLTSRDEPLDWLMAQPNIMPRLNERILSGKPGRFIDSSGTSEDTIETLRESSSSLEESLAQLSLKDLTALVDNSCHYISAKEEAKKPKHLSTWVVGDFNTAEGRSLLQEALSYTRESNSVRTCALHNQGSSKTTLVPKLVQVAHTTLSSPSARQLIVKVLEAVESTDSNKEDKAEALDITAVAKIAATVKNVDVEALISRIASLKEDAFAVHQAWSSRVAGLTAGGRAVVANGRLLGPLVAGESFQMEDHALLEKFMATTVTDRVAEAVADIADTPAAASRLIARLSGVLQHTASSAKPRRAVAFSREKLSTIKLPPRNPDWPALSVVASCDPASTSCQRVPPLLSLLHAATNCHVTLLLNAREKHSEMPLKSFYRMVAQPKPMFSPTSGALLPGPGAVFTALPESAVLTQALHAPENWLAEVVRGRYDLDNIRLSEVEGSGVSSEYSLASLLVEGHCFEHATGNPPRGLQFTLATSARDQMVDTTVMANLGYLQLKANPGAWQLELREGRSKDIYTVVSHEGTDTPGGGDPTVLLSSFQSQVVKVRVSKKPGMQDADLLSEEGEEAGGLWSTIANTFSSEDQTKEQDETVNIFSVASGHLYERFLRIMMVSVRKNTKAPVKFWFLKNFLSPTLKNSLPVLADHYGFQYELVQYKWPRWLHQQTEKQRIIWGYKILFLDVLFPLDVKKIIFVDADQVVRADIKELHDLDLDGAPYGFVPFCDSRKEMEGFRFWKHGYWRNHLGNRKYHISALFVVDLKKFRRIAAGDRLRGQYQGLSQDPNSLSNLDQDLPNNMIHQVRIKSLPMEWLWCETWCDDASKRAAKVIDVCNNPQTKEAKLVAANRIIDEWSEYDEDIKSVLARHRSTHSDRPKPERPASTQHSEL